MGVKVNPSKAINAFRRLPGIAIQSVAKAFYREGEELIAEAKEEVPVDTGALLASGFVEQPEIQGDTVTVRCGFGGPATEYAFYVHEKLDVYHPTGKPKFLEDPFNRRITGLNQRVAAQVKQDLERK
jgi:hypothetical protein